MRSSVLTRPLLGSTTPRIFTAPLVTGPPGPCGCGCALTPATSLGFSAIQFAEEVLGFALIPWQRWLFIHAFELRPGGRFRYRTVLILVARQNGKTSWVEIKNLWKMFILKVALVIGTAQDLDQAEESWDNGVAMVEGSPELAAELVHVNKTNGKKAMTLSGGQRWKIKAASRRGGRGLSGDDVNLDELREHQTWDSWGAVTKTTMARPEAQIFGFSTAGDDKSVVLNSLQAMGRAAALGERDDEQVLAELDFDPQLGLDGDTLGYFEWSAPDNVKCTCGREDDQPHGRGCRLRDREVWAQANPSLGYTITEEALASALATDPDAIFRTECLCQHVPALRDEREITAEAWAALVDGKSRRGGDLAIAIDVEPQRRWSSIGIFSPRPDGLGHIELIKYMAGTGRVVAEAARLKEKYKPVCIVIDIKGPVGSLKKAFEDAGIKEPEDLERPHRGDLLIPTAADVAAGTGQFLDAVEAANLRHIDQAELNLAVEGAETRNLSDAKAWARRKLRGPAAKTGAPGRDIAPLVAVTLARWGYLTRIDTIVPDEAEPEAYWV